MLYDERTYQMGRYRGSALKELRDVEESLIKKWLNKIGYKEPVGYYRNPCTKELEIYTTRPGILIGKAGTNVKELKKMLSEEFFGEWKVKFVEIRGGFVNV